MVASSHTLPEFATTIPALVPETEFTIGPRNVKLPFPANVIVLFVWFGARSTGPWKTTFILVAVRVLFPPATVFPSVLVKVSVVAPAPAKIIFPSLYRFMTYSPPARRDRVGVFVEDEEPLRSALGGKDATLVTSKV